MSALQYLATGRHFLCHPQPLPSDGEVQGVLDKLVVLLEFLNLDLSFVAGLPAQAHVSLPTPVFMRFFGTQCLFVFELRLNEFIQANFEPAVWRGLMKQYFDDVPFQQVI